MIDSEELGYKTGYGILESSILVRILFNSYNLQNTWVNLFPIKESKLCHLRFTVIKTAAYLSPKLLSLSLEVFIYDLLNTSNLLLNTSISIIINSKWDRITAAANKTTRTTGNSPKMPEDQSNRTLNRSQSTQPNPFSVRQCRKLRNNYHHSSVGINKPTC